MVQHPPKKPHTFTSHHHLPFLQSRHSGCLDEISQTLVPLYFSSLHSYGKSFPFLFIGYSLSDFSRYSSFDYCLLLADWSTCLVHTTPALPVWSWPSYVSFQPHLSPFGLHLGLEAWFNRPRSLIILGGECGAKVPPPSLRNPVEFLRADYLLRNAYYHYMLDMLLLNWISQSVEIALITIINCLELELQNTDISLERSNWV